MNERTIHEKNHWWVFIRRENDEGLKQCLEKQNHEKMLRNTVKIILAVPLDIGGIEN